MTGMLSFQGFKASFQFREKKSVMHRLDPRTKFFYILLVFLLIFLFPSPVYSLATLALVVGIFFVGKCSIRAVLQPLVLLTPFIIMMTILQGIWFPNRKTILFYLVPPQVPVIGGSLPVSLEGLLYGFTLAGLRLSIILIAFTSVTATTNPQDLTTAMVKMKIPYTLATMLSLGFRFFPTLVDEAETITTAQQSRGLDLEKGGLLHTIKCYFLTLTPLTVIVLKHSQDIAISMELLGFRVPANKTFLRELSLTKGDYAALVLVSIGVFMAVYLFLHGYGRFEV
jgi:energy-coupling factor transport system permease protein